MSIITLTTDFGNKDYAVGAVKAALISAISPLQIVDISHEISPYNLTECAYVLKNAYLVFPKGSIHVIGVESEQTPENRHLAMRYNDHYFIGADNVCLILGDNIFHGQGLTKTLQIAINNLEDNKSTIFGYYVNDPERYGVVTFNEEGAVTSIIEKPKAPRSNYAVVGLYSLNREPYQRDWFNGAIPMILQDKSDISAGFDG